jgi:hypothetical protein
MRLKWIWFAASLVVSFGGWHRAENAAAVVAASFSRRRASYLTSGVSSIVAPGIRIEVVA